MKSSARMNMLICAGALSVGLFAFAFLAAPNSCTWGNVAYFWAGIAVLAGIVAVPFALGAGLSMRQRIGLGLGLVVFGGGVWLAGLFVANVRVICKLF